MNWQQNYPPPQKRGLSNKHFGMIIFGLIGLALMAMVVLGAIRKRSQKELPREDRLAKQVQQGIEDKSDEIRRALQGKLKVVSTDATCQKFTCTQVKGDEFGTMSRASSKDNPDRVRIVVSEKIRPGAIAESDDYEALDCGAFAFVGGPLKGHAMLYMGDETHFMSVGYMLPSTGSGYSPELRECVVAAFR
jgi:hypothetical protein